MSTVKPPVTPDSFAKRRPGRPDTGAAVSNKDRQDAHRKRLVEAGKVRLELKVSVEVRDQLHELQALTGLDRDGAAELAIREKHHRLVGVTSAKTAPRRRA